MKNLGQFLQDDSTQRFSATRLAFLAWIFGVLIVWGAGSFHERKMQEIPASIQVLIGILMTGKVAQKINEGSSSYAPADQPSNEEGKPSGASSRNGSRVTVESLVEKR